MDVVNRLQAGAFLWTGLRPRPEPGCEVVQNPSDAVALRRRGLALAAKEPVAALVSCVRLAVAECLGRAAKQRGRAGA
jgi:hypothetical protein